MNPIKLDARLSSPFCRDYELFGRNFPKHLQVAYGRYIAKLCYNPRPLQPKFTFWLRDLPLNVYDLESSGFQFARQAFESESLRKRGVC